MAELESTIQEPYALQEETEGGKPEQASDAELKIIGTDYSYTHQILWVVAFVYAVMHAAAAAGLLLCLSGHVKVATMLWGAFLWYVGVEGITMGSHRCFSHRSYKATPLLKILLLMMQTVSGQASVYKWCRDHRVHHRYSDTDADPHNSKRGFFYCHFGWLVTSRHPLSKAMRKTIDLSDLEQDKLVMLQYRYYQPIYFVLGFLIPVSVPVYFFNESFLNSLTVCYFLQYICSLHAIWCVNSFAHKFGTRPYDKTIQSVETWFVSLVSNGEGWHNYHHAYPWDYKASELGMPLNATASLIRLAEFLGLAYDLKTVDKETINKRIKSKGDGSYKAKDMDQHVTAIGPLHPLNPLYTARYEDPEVKLKVKIKA